MPLATVGWMRILPSNMMLAVALPESIAGYLWLYASALALAVIAALLLCIRRLPGWIRSIRASSWPISQATVEGVSVKTVSGQALGELAYSYFVNGERYSGYVLLQFADEQDAWEAIDPLKGQLLFVRYEAVNPAVSAFRQSDQSWVSTRGRESFLKHLILRQVLEPLGCDPASWTRLAAWTWPIVKGRVEHSAVSERGDAEDWWLALSFMVEISYSYSVAGEYYSGRLQRSFFRESSALGFVNMLKERGVFVRYNQGSPDISVARYKDQAVFQSSECHAVPHA